MYQFTTTTIINSNLDSNGTTAKYAGAATYFQVTRVGKFLTDKILSITKRPYAAGVKEVAQVRIPTITSGLVARLTIDVRLAQQTNSEYANTYLYFKKPVTVEIIASGTAATDAAAFVAQLNGLKDRFGYSYVTAAVTNTDYVQITATDDNQRIFDIKVEKEVTLTLNSNSIIQPEYENVTAGTFSVTTAGKLGFGDDAWMIKGVMIPTLENTRYFGINKEERPIIGGNYTEYVIRYQVDKDHDEGVWSGAKSLTTHVFWVKSDLVASFETELDKLTNKPYQIAVTADDTTLANSATAQASATGAIGAVVWSVTSGTSATVNATTGVITAHGTTDGDTVIRGTDSVGNYDEVTITVA